MAYTRSRFDNVAWGFLADELTKPVSSLIADEELEKVTLNSAAKKGHLLVVQDLLEMKADYLPNKEGLFPLHGAAQKGHLNVVRFFIERTNNKDIHTVTLNKELNSPLHCAIEGAPYQAKLGFYKETATNVKRLIEYLATRAPYHTVNAKGKTPLRCALDRWNDWWEGADRPDDYWLDVVVALFDPSQFTHRNDFAIMISLHNLKPRFNMVTCMLARSDDFEKGFNALIAKFEARIDENWERTHFAQIKNLKKEFLNLVNDLKSFIPENPVFSPFLNLLKIEEAMRNEYIKLALVCKNTLSLFPALGSDLTYHVVSFLIAPNVGAKPEAIIEVMKKTASQPTPSKPLLPTSSFSFNGSASGMSTLASGSSLTEETKSTKNVNAFFKSPRFNFYRRVAKYEKSLRDNPLFTNIEDSAEITAPDPKRRRVEKKKKIATTTLNPLERDAMAGRNLRGLFNI